MADREFTLNVNLTAKNDTDRAFAEAEGNIEVYNRLLEEQAAKSDVVVKANQRLSTSHKQVVNDLGDLTQGHKSLLNLQARYADAADRSAKAESKAREGDIRSINEQADARKNLLSVQNAISKEITNIADKNKKFNAQDARDAASEYQARARQQANYREISKLLDEINRKRAEFSKAPSSEGYQKIKSNLDEIAISLRKLNVSQETISDLMPKIFNEGKLSSFAAAQARVNATMAEYQRLIDNVAKSEKSRDETNRRLGGDTTQHQALRERLDVNVDAARAKLDEFRATERAHAVSVSVHLDDANVKNAREILDSLDVSRHRGGGTAQPKVGPGTSDPYGFSQLGKSVQGVQKNAAGLGQSFTHIFSALSPAMIQPLLILMTGMAAGFASIGSAALAAGTAMSSTFLVSIAEGVPVMGLFGAAMQRLQGVMGLVSGELALQQQRFIAQYQAAYQNALGINQVVIAQHQYSDALYSQNMALYQVRVAEVGLLGARQQATRQLQQLVFEETNARLAAEASSLAVADAQRNLLAATGGQGDFQQAQLQLAQAQAGHTQAVAQAQQAITNAASGSVARQQIQESVVQAKNAVTQARRAVVDANFAAVQARAAIIQAEQAQQGFNVGTAAQLAYLRSQMTRTELVLSNSILNIFKLFRGAHGILTPMTDAILRPFIGIADSIYNILQRPRVLQALQTLANAIGSTIGEVSKVFLDQRGVNLFISLIQDAAKNMAPLAKIIVSIFTIMGRVIQTAAPYVHQFAIFLSNLIGQFAGWSNTNQGKNWLKQWFDEAFKSLEAFIKLGIAVGRLIAAIVGVGGGAKSGINTLGQLTSTIDHATNSINSHGKAWRELQKIWAAVGPTMHFVGQILGALASAFLKLTGTKQGQEALKGLGDILSKILIPAFADFIGTMGKIMAVIGQFLSQNPKVAGELKNFLEVALIAGAAMKIFGGLFAPLFKLIGLMASLAKFGEAFATSFSLVGEGGLGAALASIAGPAAIIAGVVGSIILLAKWTGTLKLLWQAIESPFIAIWNAIKAPIQNLIKQFESLIGKGTSFKRFVTEDLTGVFTVMKTILGGVGKFIGDVLGHAITVVADIFKLIHDITQGHIGAVAKDFLKIGEAVVSGLWDGLKDLVKIISGVFVDLVNWVLGFFGISSPSKKFKSIGKSIVDGLMSAVLGLPTLFLHLAEDVVKFFIKGISKLPSLAGKLISSIIPGPIKNIVSGAGHIAGGVIHGVASAGGTVLHDLNPLNWNKGGAVPGGFGGGDIIPARLEPGEHVFTKDEVRTAGGHGAMFALRRMLGGGTQGGGGRYAAGGVVGTITSSVPSINPERAPSYSLYYTQILTLLNDFVRAYINNTKTLWQTVVLDSNQSLQQMITQTNQSLQKLGESFKQTYNQITQDTHKAFDYIANAANSDLRAFGAKPAHISVEAPPHFAGGGWVGNKGERGDDVVHAMLGRGEAVLNYAHQRVVEPAMKAYYGWGLGDMFGKVRGSHGQGRGYSVGGYVYPFPGGTQVGRTDQGVDADLPVGAPIGPMGRARVMGRLANWYQGQPLIWWQLLDGIRKGAYAYVAEQITNLAPTGAILNANDAIARYAPSGTGIEYGWATANGSTLARVQGGYTEGVATAAGDNMRAFIAGLQHGSLISGGGALGTAASLGGVGHAAFSQIRDMSVKGSGILSELLRHAVKRVTNAANKSLGSADGGAGGATGSISSAGIAPGSWMKVASQIARRFGWGAADLRAWQGVENIEDSAYSLTAKNPKSSAYGLAQGITGPNWYYGYGGNPNTLVGQLIAMANYMKGRYGSPLGALAHEHSAGWYNQGGFVGKAMPIIAHAGEWVVNKAQQHGLARRLGTSIGGLRNSMGFTGGPHSFAGGGVIGQDYQDTSRFSTHPLGGSLALEGQFNLPLVAPDYTATYEIAALGAYQRAQQIVQNIQRSGKNFSLGLRTFMTNFENAGNPSNGLFALAAQAVSNFSNQQSTIVQLASAGVRTTAQGIMSLMKRGPQTAFQAAATTTTSMTRVISQTQDLADQYTTALRGVNREIAAMYTDGKRNSRFNDNRYRALVNARSTFIDGLQAQDQNLAQDYTTQLQNRQAQFQAQYTQILRGTGTLRGSQFGQALSGGISRLKNIGPAITSGLVSTAQTIAQTMGNYGALVGGIDQSAIDVAKQQRSDLQSAYNKAAKKAQHDPRWQSVADDLLSQLESATEAVAQAQAQALTDAITQVQNSQTIQQAGFQMAQTLNTATAAASNAVGYGNQTTAAASNISLNAANTQALQGQFVQYESLLGTAQAQGNQNAILQLTQALDDLNGQIAQSIVATQQAITAYNQIAVNIASSTSTASSGFIQSASGIITTLGQISGSLNLPQQISTLQQYGQGLIQQGQTAVGNIQQTIGQGNAFGDASGTANSYLAQAANAFNQGPQSYASWLAANSQGIASFQAGLPQDQQALFTGLIQAVTDNTTATVQNNLALQNLNATTNQQQFTSAAWTQFRTAIFNGIGGLLPQYAMQVQSLDVGGTLTSHGLIYAHKGETITPASVVKGQTSSAPTHQEIHNHFTEPMEIADPVHISNRIAWKLNHDPNSR